MKYILLYIFILYSFICYAQANEIDSLKKSLRTHKQDSNKVKTLNLLSEQLVNDRSAALSYAKEALSLSQKLKFKTGEAEAYLRYAIALKGKNYFGERGSPDQILENLEKAISIFKLTNNPKIAECYSEIARVYYDMTRNFPEAIKNELTAFKIYQQTNNKKKLAVSYLALSHYYFEDDNSYMQALNFLRASLQLFEELKDSVNMAYALNNMGMHYRSEGDYDTALRYFNHAHNVYEKMGSRAPDFGIPWTNGNIALVYILQSEADIKGGNFQAALLKLQAALRLTKERLQIEIKGQMSHRQTYDDLGHCYFLLGIISKNADKTKYLLESEKYYDMLLKYGEQVNDKYNILHGYAGLYQVNDSLGNNKLAYDYYKKYIIYRDSLWSDGSTQKISEIKMQYAFDKKQDSIKIEQDKKDDLVAAKLKNQMLIRDFSITGTAAIIAFSGIGFYRYRRRRKLQSQQEMLRERLRISRELHDDMGSTLGSISIYSEVAKNRSSKNENADEVILKIGVASRELIDKMSDIVWSINPNNESIEQLQNRMQTFAAMILTPHNIQYSFLADEAKKKVKLNAEERKNIFLIFKEAIHNIVKYAECKSVEISLSQQNDRLEMIIKDDGKGFDITKLNEADSLGGNGIKNMKARAESINAMININSKINEGTIIKLKLNV